MEYPRPVSESGAEAGMRRALCLAARLYPARWRTRYGREFEALIEDVEPGWRYGWDVLLGAMEMQMATWSATCASRGCLLSARTC